MRTVMNEGIPLACQELGGSGQPIVLMHGAGMNQQSMAAVGTLLAKDHRVITFDFRGHGQSGRGLWTMETAVSDLSAVITAYELVDPVVAGHSLGGMVSAAFGAGTTSCRAAVNIDGQGQGVPEQYDGKDPVEVAAWLTAQEEKSRKLLKSPLLKAVGKVQSLRGKPAPDPGTVEDIITMVGDLDLPELYERTQVPLLVVNATGPSTGVAKHLMKDPENMLGAYRRGISRTVREVGTRNPLVHLTEIVSSHALIRTHPAETAQAVRDFLS